MARGLMTNRANGSNSASVSNADAPLTRKIRAARNQCDPVTNYNTHAIDRVRHERAMFLHSLELGAVLLAVVLVIITH